MDPVEMSDVEKLPSGMMLDLGALTMKTQHGPLAQNVDVGAWTDVAYGDELLGCSNTWVC